MCAQCAINLWNMSLDISTACNVDLGTCYDVELPRCFLLGGRGRRTHEPLLCHFVVASHAWAKAWFWSWKHMAVVVVGSPHRIYVTSCRNKMETKDSRFHNLISYFVRCFAALSPSHLYDGWDRPVMISLRQNEANRVCNCTRYMVGSRRLALDFIHSRAGGLLHERVSQRKLRA